MPNDRSDAALRERLELAEKATKGPWQTDVSPGKKGFEPSYVVKDGDGLTIVDILPVAAYQANAAHIAASSPDVVREDIEEILRLREEVARLNEEADWLAESLDIITRFFAPEVINDLKYKSWREAAREAVEEEERHG